MTGSRCGDAASGEGLQRGLWDTLWRGEYATDFSDGTAPYDMFGDGRDGVMPSSGNLNNNNGFGTRQVNSGTAGSTSISLLQTLFCLAD